jgi:hypothetical protein
MALPPELAGVSLPAWAQFLAQDADGTWWAYEAHPNQQHNGWYENEVGRIQRLAQGSPNGQWEEALIRLAEPDSSG